MIGRKLAKKSGFQVETGERKGESALPRRGETGDEREGGHFAKLWIPDRCRAAIVDP